ncbi:MAG: hypothetical protein J5601_02380 [Elusimicrobiaceae bacterium]|nr:hypothetical protein [Elusimicrobiaceae bacterium]
MKISPKIAKWCDEWKMAWMGAVLATRKRSFLIAAGVSFVVFGTLLSFLSVSGVGAFKVFSLKTIFSAFLGLFGVGRSTGEWLNMFFVVIFQSILIGLIVFVWKKRKEENSANVQSAGIAAGLALIGAGCPTCGTTLITPILSMIFSSGGYAMAATVSGIITFVAILVTLFAIKKVGLEAYVIIVSERYKARKESNNEKSD